MVRKPKGQGRREFLTKAGVAGLGAAAASTIAAPAIAQSAPAIKWRLAASWPKSIDTVYGACEFFSKRVAEMSDNKFTVQVFAAGEIVPALQVLDAVQNGTVECGHTASYYYFGKDDAFVFGSELPFGMNSRQKIGWLMHGGGLELLDEFYANYNCQFAPMGNTHCQMGGWFRKPIKTIADMKGLKFRMGGFAGKVMQKLGVVPQQIAGGDIYPALEKGTIDGAEWVGPYDDEKLGFYKVAKFYHYPGWWESSSSSGLFLNKEKFAALPKPYQAMVYTAAAEAGHWLQAKYDALNPLALKRLVANGAVLVAFSPEVMDACWKAANDLFAEINATNPKFKKIYDHYVAFRDNEYLWTQIADYTMDSYMIRYRNAQK